MKQNSSIVTQIVLKVSCVFLIIILALLAAVSLIYTYFKKKAVLDNQLWQARNTCETVDEKFRSLVTLIINLANYSETQRLLKEADELYSHAWLTCIRNLDDYLFNIDSLNSVVVDIAIMKPDSGICYSTTNSFSQMYDYVRAEWFQEALSSKGLIKYAPPHGNAHLFNKVSSSFTAVYPVYSKEDLLGYIMVEMNLAGIASLFSGSRSLGTVDNYLLTASGETILHSGGAKDALPSDVLAKLGEYGPEGNASFWKDGRYYVISRLSTVDWYVVFINDYQSILTPVIYCLKIAICVILVGVLILFLVIYVLTKRIGKQFDDLVTRISSYDGSGKSLPLHPSKIPREIFSIHEKFEEMTEHINCLIQQVYVATLLKQQMQMEVLMNQINPHFLYNTLQVIQTKAVLEGNRELEDMIFSLGRMLRYSMDQQESHVTIEKELKYIQDYIMFYKERFPNLFTYEIRCPKALRKFYTVKFVLQPVVENCFKHAFANRKQGGRIEIAVEEEADGIRFDVTDNGSGIDPDSLLKLRKSLQEEPDIPCHIGLANTHKRIRLAYGSQYGITITSCAMEGTKISILIARDDDSHSSGLLSETESVSSGLDDL